MAPDLTQILTLVATAACGVLLTDIRARIVKMEGKISEHGERLAKLEERWT